MLEINKTIGIVAVTSLFTGSIAGGGTSYLLMNSVSNPNYNQSIISYSNKVIEEESAMIDSIEKVSPAVLSIIASKDLQQFYTNPFFFFNGRPFEVNPNPNGNGSGNDGEKTQVGGGTGFLVTKNGLVLTNRHVVNDDQAEYTAVMSDGKTYYASVISKDPTNDLAVLQIFTDEERKTKPEKLPTLTLGNSDNLKIGSKVIAIGNALSEFDNTTTSGIISGKGRQITAGGARTAATTLSNLLQTDAAINPGNSGGPLVNLQGEVIGINTAVAQQANGIGFAIPINDVKTAIESVQETGKIVRPFLGVRYTELNPQIASELGFRAEFGAYLIDDIQNRVPAILKGSPADKAGLRSGDIITSVNNEKISQQTNLMRLIGKYKVGETVELTVLRGTQTVNLKVKLEEFTEIE